MELSFYTYILKSAICLSVFYISYRLWLSKETFHKYNRVLLLGFLLVSFLIPSLKVSQSVCLHNIDQVIEKIGGPDTQIEKTFILDGEERTPGITVSEELKTDNSDFRILTLDNWWILYWVGVLFALLRYLGGMFCLYRLIHSNKGKPWKDGIRLIIHNQKIDPFSWGRYIIISQCDLDEYGAEILAHEQAHISHRHYEDLLLVDICCILQWFNPMVWFLKKELKTIHEFEADESVLKEGIDIKHYQLLLIKKTVGTRLYSMANGFNHNSLKKRITMMLKEKSNSWKLLKYLMVLPLTAIAVALFARPNVLKESDGMYTDSLKLQEIPILKSYAECDTVQILELDLNKMNLSENQTSWGFSMFTSTDTDKGVNCVTAVLTNKGKCELRLSSSRPWTKETLNDFTKIVEKAFLESLERKNEVNTGEAPVVSITSSVSVIKTETMAVKDFFEVYLKANGYNGELILLDGEEISYQQLKELSPADILKICCVLPDTTNLKQIFGEKAQNGVLVLVSKKNPDYWLEFEKKLKQSK